MKDDTIWLYKPTSSIVHRFHPLVKLTLFFTSAILALILSGHLPWLLVGFFLLVAVTARVLGTLAKASIFYLWMFGIPILIIAVIGPENTAPLITYGPVGVTKTELLTFSNLFAQVLALVLAGLLFAFTTHPEELHAALIGVGVSRGFAFAFIGGLQLIPLLRKRAIDIRHAQLSRGVPADGRIWERVQSVGAMFRPLMLSVLNEAHDREITLLLRGFASEKPPTLVHPQPLTKRHSLIIFGLLFITTIIIALVLFI